MICSGHGPVSTVNGLKPLVRHFRDSHYRPTKPQNENCWSGDVRQLLQRLVQEPGGRGLPFGLNRDADDRHAGKCTDSRNGGMIQPDSAGRVQKTGDSGYTGAGADVAPFPARGRRLAPPALPDPEACSRKASSTLPAGIRHSSRRSIASTPPRIASVCASIAPAKRHVRRASRLARSTFVARDSSSVRVA